MNEKKTLTLVLDIRIQTQNSSVFYCLLLTGVKLEYFPVHKPCCVIVLMFS